MTFLRTNIKRKLMTAIMGTSITVLLLTCAVFIAYEVISFRKNLVRGMNTRAEILAVNSTASLAFQNELDAAEVLSALRKDSRMTAAALYDKDGNLFAKYLADALDGSVPSRAEAPGHRFEPEHFVVSVPVLQEGRHLGTMYLKFSLSAMRERYQFYAVLVLCVIASSVLLAYLLSVWLQKRIANPILTLADTARSVSERKDYTLRARKRSDDEIGLLTDSFNDMLGEVQQRETALRENEARLRAILESALDAVITMDHEGRIVEFNPAAEMLFGYSRSRAIGGRLAELIIPPSLRESHARGLLKYLATGEAGVIGKRIEITAMRADGTEFSVELAITRIAQQEPPMFTGFIRDITKRKQAEQEIRQLNAELEQRVHERTAELEASNRELEAFSYSVSHDLRAPLRGIDGFSKALIDDHASSLNDEARHYLERVRAAARRMAMLIDDLLKLSRISRVEMHRELVDLSAIARQIEAELRQANPGRNVTMHIEDNLRVQGDTQLLRVVLDNLIGNAWKYTSKHPASTIEFGSNRKGRERIFHVRDDGAGFDMVHANLLFTPFQRLHRQTDFEGTGVGLATVHRVIQRHGGRLWAEAEVEKGATFYFTL